MTKTLSFLVALLACFCLAKAKVADPDPDRFAKTIASFEKEDATLPKKENLTLFTGSSSIRLWKTLAEDFPSQQTLNRGFGGSHISDALHHFDRLVGEHKPMRIVLYCGENDLWHGKPPEQVATDFKEFAKRTRLILPKTKIYYIPCKPSPKRWEKWPVYQRCNNLIAKQCESDEKLHFLDLASKMLGEDGRPLPEIWSEDQLHMNAKGYAIWAKFIRPVLASQRVRK